MLEGACAVHAVSEREIPALHALHVPFPIRHVPNGLSTSWLENKRPYDAEGPWLYLGRLEWEKKGLDLLVEAYAHLARVTDTPPLLIVGPDWKGGRARVIGAIERSGMRGRIVVRDSVHGSEKVDLMASASLLILPSRHEGMPVTILEAMALGIPVLVSPGTNMVETVNQARCGLIAAEGERGLREAMHAALATSAAERRRLGARGRAHVARNLTWPAVARRMADLYHDCLRRTARTVGGCVPGRISS
jgi:glycosyltransferase involved in cell wall biosynthesis